MFPTPTRLAGLWLALTLLTLAAPGPAHAQAQARVYHFSPVNQWDLTQTAAYWNPIVDYVSGKSGVDLKLKLGRTSADTTAYVLANEVEFVFSNHLFSPDRVKLGWHVFGRRAGGTIRGQIVVAADSAIQTLGDLSGRSVGFAGPEAFIGYKVTMAELLKRGVKATPVFHGNQNAAFAALFSARVAAVGSNSMLVDGVAKREGRQFRVLWTSEGYHDLALMASSRVPRDTVQAVSAAFLNMHLDPAGRKALDAAARAVGLVGDNHFVTASDRDYDNYVRFYESAPSFMR